jgi:hypothetical protein
MAAWVITQAQLAEETLDELVVSPTSTWFGWATLSGVLLVCGVAGLFFGWLAYVISSWALVVVGVFLALLGGVSVLRVSTVTTLRLNKSTPALTLTQKPLWKLGQQTTMREVHAATGVIGQHNYAGLLGHTVLITTPSERITLQFGRRGQDAERLMQALQGLNGQATAAASAETTAPPVNLDTLMHGAMLREIRSWGFWQLGLGALHIFASGVLSAPYGFLLIGVGLASFYFREAAMFVLYATTMSWAAFSNLLSGESRWVVGGVFQLYLAFRILQAFRRFRQTEVKLAPSSVIDPDDQTAGRAGRIFPWAALASGAASFALFIFAFGGLFLLATLDASGPWIQWLSIVESVTVNLGILGAGLGLAALLSRFHRRAASIIGLILGAIPVIGEIGLLVLSLL